MDDTPEPPKPVNELSFDEIIAELGKLQYPKDADRIKELEDALGGGGFIS